MKKLTLGQRGFSVFELLISIVLLAALAGAGYFVLTRQNSNNARTERGSHLAQSGSSNAVVWAFDEQKQEWFVQRGKAPKCEKDFEYSPVEFTELEAVLLPGQYRGYNYKSHGGLGMRAESVGQVEVKMPLDGTITGLTRYLEGPDGGALQYLVTFVNDCGLEMKFDHLAALSPRLQAIAETRPPAKLNDTRSDPNNQPAPEIFEAGEVIATVVGNPSMQSYGFDFGVLDYRERNPISRNKTWAGLHDTYSASEWYGICWFDMLPGDDAATAKALSERVINPNKPNVVSDYCEHISTKTLEVNDGRPTDG